MNDPQKEKDPLVSHLRELHTQRGNPLDFHSLRKMLEGRGPRKGNPIPVINEYFRRLIVDQSRKEVDVPAMKQTAGIEETGKITVVSGGQEFSVYPPEDPNENQGYRIR